MRTTLPVFIIVPYVITLTTELVSTKTYHHYADGRCAEPTACNQNNVH